MGIAIKVAALLLIIILPGEYVPFILITMIGINLAESVRKYLKRRKGVLINRIVLKSELPKDSEYEIMKGAEIITTFLKLLTNALSLVYLLYLTHSLSLSQGTSLLTYVLISTAMVPFVKFSYEQYRQSLGGQLEFVKEGTVVKMIEDHGDFFLDKDRKKPIGFKMVEILIGKDKLTVGCDEETYARMKIGDEVILIVDI